MAGATLSSASLNAGATQLSTTWSQGVDPNVGNPIIKVNGRGVSIASSYLSGTATLTIIWTLAAGAVIFANETVTVDIAAAVVVNDSDSGPNLAIVGAAVTNNSTVANPALNSLGEPKMPTFPVMPTFR